MDDESIYGKVIFNYSTRQAINDGYLVTYNIVAPFLSSNHLEYNDICLF
jgi:type I site-specific restriction endonuclease